ncbi:Uu.00g129760.m01.CDS01 [Anthostomella pinea]|uniref:1-alkyl-2-acetylglycerophosphocholine esterase n=1 Tax=Anthostomella pinea TaxID=933095 RepID=A0AAI8YI84_9PEZI|nr:Uu.00g129760.m01.CDS01 [Anthostomella pinea]
MHLREHALIGAAAKIPISAPRPVMSFSPVVLPFADRKVDLELRVSVPSTGDALPIILLSHGHGRSNYLSSLEGYAPLSSFWAGHGFAVIQPTHLSSKSLSLQSPTGQELLWQSRAQDMVRILDELDTIEAAVPALKGRLDRSRIAVAGHSLGALTASMLLGMKNTDPRDGSSVQTHEKRIKAGVILAGPGNGGSDLSEFGRSQLVPFYGPDFSTMTTPALVVCGDEDVGPHLTVRGMDWHADSYRLAPGPKALFMLKSGKHCLGGISGWDAKESADEESPERLAAVQRMTWAYLMSQLYDGNKAWDEACEALGGLGELGTVETR